VRIKNILRRFAGLIILSIFCVGVTEGLVFFSDRLVRSPLRGLENQISDLAFQVRDKNESHQKVTCDDIVIIDIDDASIEALGRPQLWPRSYDAAAINYVASGNPKSIGIDYLYTENDALPEVYRRKLYQKGFENSRDILNALSSDAELAQAIFDSRKTYLSIFDDDSKYDVMMDTNALGYLRFIKGNNDSVFWPPLLSHPIIPISDFAATAKANGTISMPTELDGTVRDYYLLHEIPLVFDAPMYIANFPFYIYLDDIGLSEEDVVVKGSALQIGDKATIPLDEQGRFKINWTGKQDKIRYISFFKVIDGRVPAEFFENKYVFFGTSASGMQDLKTVPSSNQKMPGVEVHAIAFLNMMNQSFIKNIREAEMLPYLLIISFLLTMIFFTLKPIIGFITSLVLVIVELFAFVLYILPKYEIIFPIVSVMLLTLLSYILTSLYIYLIREKKSRRLKFAFGTYVSPDVVEQIARDSSSLQLGGEKKELTVLFSDIRGFTSYSEKLDPQEIVAMLNDYLSRMSEAILAHKGTIDKFIGDAIMAIFGAPIYQKDHAKRACQVALEMNRVLEEFNNARADRGDEKIQIGIGINTGEMTVGNIGSQKRFDYTVIGDAVNLGSRLESLTKFFGVSVLVSETTKEAAGENSFLFRQLPSVVVKGKEKPVLIYELIDSYSKLSEYSEYLQLWTEALAAYNNKEFEQSKSLFSACALLRTNDLVADYYIRMCDDCLEDINNFSTTIKLESK
jgi:adenylate cyclase